MPVFAAIAVIGLILVLALSGKAQAQDTASGLQDESEVPPPDVIQNAMPEDSSNTDHWSNTMGSDITTDPATWPSGDKIWDCCRAIAIAEGYNTVHAAFKNNNPGDLSDGFQTFGGVYTDGSNVTKFPDAATGWNWLYRKISNHINGKSSTYPANLTITQVAQKWAANWQNWKNNVGRELNVDPDTTSFSDYVNQ